MLPLRPSVPRLLPYALVGDAIVTVGYAMVLMVSVCVCFVCYQSTVFVYVICI